MAAKGPVDVSQIVDFAKRLAAIPQEMRDATNAAIDKTVGEFETKLQNAVPVGDKAPHIKDSIRTFDGNAELHERGIEIGDSALVYAMSLEFGHRNAKDGSLVPAQPFFVPVNRIMRKRHRNRMRTALRKALKAIQP